MGRGRDVEIKYIARFNNKNDNELYITRGCMLFRGFSRRLFTKLNEFAEGSIAGTG